MLIAAAVVVLIFEFEGQGLAAVRTLNFTFIQYGAVDADLLVAVRAFYFVNVLIVVAAAAIVVTLVILFGAVNLVFKGAEVFIYSL